MSNDLISREYIKAFICEYEKFNGKETEIVKAIPIQAIDNAPTVDITEEQAIDKLHETGWMQKHDKEMTERPIGKWVYDGVYHDENNPIDSDIYHCSICKRSIITTLTRPTDLFPFCHCGAEMKEAENEQV